MASEARVTVKVTKEPKEAPDPRLNDRSVIVDPDAGKVYVEGSALPVLFSQDGLVIEVQDGLTIVRGEAMVFASSVHILPSRRRQA